MVARVAVSDPRDHARRGPGSRPRAAPSPRCRNNARIDLPARVRFRNQNSAATQITAATTEIACDVLMAEPLARGR